MVKKYKVYQEPKTVKYRPKLKVVSKQQSADTLRIIDLRTRLKEIKTIVEDLKIEKKYIDDEIKCIQNPYYRNMTIKLYVLRLEDSCWYVGSSWNPLTRFEKHRKKKGANWTRIHRPIEIFKVIDTFSRSQEEVAIMEDDLTIEYAQSIGVDFVRGGGFCQTKPRWPTFMLT